MAITRARAWFRNRLIKELEKEAVPQRRPNSAEESIALFRSVQNYMIERANAARDVHASLERMIVSEQMRLSTVDTAKAVDSASSAVNADK